MSATSDSKTYLPNSRTCFVCGDQNPAGLHVRFHTEDGAVQARWRPRPDHCGYQNVVHGGVAAAIVDECMGWAAARAIGRLCLTAELTIRYLRRMPGDQDLTVRADVLKATKRLAHVDGAITDDAGVVYVRAQGRFVPLSAEETRAVDDGLIYRGDEERVFDPLRGQTHETRPAES